MTKMVDFLTLSPTAVVRTTRWYSSGTDGATVIEMFTAADQSEPNCSDAGVTLSPLSADVLVVAAVGTDNQCLARTLLDFAKALPDF
jgi:hypothetical protein